MERDDATEDTMKFLTMPVDNVFRHRFDVAREKLGVQTDRAVFEHAFALRDQALAAIEADRHIGSVDTTAMEYETFLYPRLEADRTRLAVERRLASHAEAAE